MPETVPIACSLEQSELLDRARAMARLGGRLVAVEAEGRDARLRFAASHGAVDEFVRAESDCCPFFDFTVAERGEDVELRVGAPEGGEWAVRGLVAGFVAAWGALV
jgi:hypothetical protein